MLVQDVIDTLNLYTANLDVCVQIDGGDMDYELTIEEYPSGNSPTEVRITANGDETKSSVSDVITALEALTANLPVVATVGENPVGDVIGLHAIPDGEETDILIVAIHEVIPE